MKRLVISAGMLLAASLGGVEAASCGPEGNGTVRETPIKFGISETFMAKEKRADFSQSVLGCFYRENGIEATCFSEKKLDTKGATSKQLAEIFNEFHVLCIRPFGEGLRNLDPDWEKTAGTVSAALQEYVKSGGGLIVQMRPSRYADTPDAKYWNAVFAPFGLTLDNNHGIACSQTVKAGQKPGSSNEFFYTDNILPHEITKGVRGLWLPVNSHDGFPACPVIRYSPDYSILVKTGKDGGAYFCDEKVRGDFIAGKTPVIPAEEALPIVAVRQFGKGVVVSIGVDMIHTGMNFRNPFWGNITEEKGLNGKPSDLMTLMVNAVRFAAGPARENPRLGTYVPVSTSPIPFPEAVYWDSRNFAPQPGALAYGIFGAHTSYSDGKSTVEEYVKSAKEAGLRFIVFADPIGKLTPEKLEQLKADCRACSDETFYACPGMEFTDGCGLKRYVYGERIRHPGIRKYKFRDWEYYIFDGEKVQSAGYFIIKTCAFSQNGYLDSQDFPKSHVHPENLWWFWASVPRMFEQGRLIADNEAFGRQMLHDLRMLVPITFDRIFSAEEVQKSKMTAVTGGYSLALIKKMLNSSNGYWSAENSDLFCSYGNGGALKLNAFRFINAQEDPRRLHTRGTQRVRGYFNVESPEGIREVRVMDRNRKPLLVFDGKGEKVFSKKFELVHDKQHYVFLEVEDMKGARLISHFIRVYDYKQSLVRCNDNMNILGALGIFWHPNWPEKLMPFKYFRNAELLSVQGWDRGSADCPRPKMVPLNMLYTEDQGAVYPFNTETTDGVVMDVKLAGGDLQIVEADMDEIVERFANAKRGETWAPSPPRVLADNEYFSHHQRIYYLRDRQDFHLAWDCQRLRESLKDYDGAMCLITGEIRFRKDLVLSGARAVPFVIGQTIVDPHIGPQDAIWIVKDRNEGLIVRNVPKKERPRLSGQIAENGFALSAWSAVGALAVFPVSDSDWRYEFLNSSMMEFGFGTPGKTYKAGESIRYAFISATVANDSDKPEKYETLSRMIHGEYPNRIERGKKIPEPVFLHVVAEENEAAFEIGPAKGLGIDLPIKVSRLQDNGCTAIYSTKRPWFRFIGIADGENTAYTQEPMEEKNHIWIGNVFTAENPDLRLTLVVDGQSPDAKPFLEIHNPSGQEIKSTISSPRGTPVFGGTSFSVTVPPKDSVTMPLKSAPEGKADPQ